MRDAFAGIVDYAGLFPPASCNMPDAVRQYHAYRASADRWMLGRFVVAASRLEELGAVITHQSDPLPVNDRWEISAVLGANVPDEVERIERFHEQYRELGLAVTAVECRAASPGQIMELDKQLPRGLTRYLELPAQGPYRALVEAVQRAGSRAKIRTGGTTADMFPEPHELTGFLIAVTSHGVQFKATAGLHHPFRGEYSLTYASDSGRAPMYGFVGVLLATALLRRNGDSETAQAILEDEDADAFRQFADRIEWRGERFSAAELAETRALAFDGFGSCSFREPVEELALELAA